jgi:hypothetical protein
MKIKEREAGLFATLAGPDLFGVLLISSGCFG